MFYLDDGLLVRDVDRVIAAFRSLLQGAAVAGLEVNLPKFEVWGQEQVTSWMLFLA